MEKIIDVQPGQTILEQGEEGSGFFVLKSGTLEVFKDDILLAVIMYPGTIFGEMGDILGRPRSCSVRAKNEARIAYYEIDSLDSLVCSNPEIAVKLIRTLASRLDRTTQKLIDTARENPLWSTK
ncbi:MAG: cyclic nucleotide-binding domain-containing protein [Verrucomicrobia bacterium]|jgi:CRP-like cAMP-binding protein|nr:cyclic nucleotide-binding domain-containing protein [Verrucomicrobiota bacterium]